MSPKMRERVIGDLILEIENASACIKRIYQTQSKKDLTTGLFVESNGSLTENGLVYQDSTRFFAAVNCLVYYFDSVFMADLVNEMEKYSIGGNSEKIIKYIARCKDRKEPIIVYSKYFKDGHIVLPLEASMFERRISPLVKRRHSIVKHKRSGRRGSVTKKIG